MNDVEMINWYKVSKVLGEHNRRVINKRPYTIEEIQWLLAKADQRMRVVILLLCSTGMHIGALTDITLRNVQRIEAELLCMIENNLTKQIRLKFETLEKLAWNTLVFC